MDLFPTTQHGPLNWTPSEIYGDLRRFRASEGPSRLVRLPQLTPSGGAFAYSKQYDKTVVVGRETLRFLTVSDQPGSGAQGDDSSVATTNGHRSLATAFGPGGTRASAGPNFWSSRLRATHQMTDVAWGPEAFSDRVFTSCSNGEIMSWNLVSGGLRFDTSLPGGARSVNIVNSATLSSYSIATGSTDGSVKLWDLRHPRSPAVSLSSHGSAVRSLTFGQAEIAPVHVVFGLESGMILRYDLRMRIEYLDRVFAHTACVHDLAWLPPSKDDTCAGYLASGSFDHTVKVWQIDLARLSTKPLHTLHAPYPIGKLGWRPGPQFATEVVVLPYHSGGGGSQRLSNGAGTADQSAPDSLEKFAPRVWDIRKGWVAKWALDAADGPATDLSVHSSDTIHVLYKTGAFMQHDLREATRPPELMPRHALSWSADDSLFFVADKPRLWDPPYDDLHPAVAPLLSDYGLLDKHPGDRLSTATTQVLGMQNISAADTGSHGGEEEPSRSSLNKNRQRFMKLARGYVHHGTDKVSMCETNQAVATEAGDIDVAQTWGLLSALLRDLPERPSVARPMQAESVPLTAATTDLQATSPGATAEKVKAKEPQSATRARPNTPPLTAATKGDPGRNDGSASKRKRSDGLAILSAQQEVQNQKRRGSSPSLLSALRPHSRSLSSSPVHHGVKLPSTTLASVSYIARHLSNRRVSISSGGKSKSPGPTPDDKKPGWVGGGFAAIASGALEDSGSDDEEGDTPPSDGAIGQSDTGLDSSWTKEKRHVVTKYQHPTLGSSSSSSHSSPAIGGKKSLPPSHLTNNIFSLLSNSKLASPQIHSQLLDIQDVNENDGDESDGIDEDGASRSSESLNPRRSRSQSSSESAQLHAVDIPPDANTRLSPPSPTLAKYVATNVGSSQMATISRAGLRVTTRQGSDSSATVNPFGELGMGSSFGSSMMTPTIGRLSLGVFARREVDIPKVTDSPVADPRVGSMTVRTSPSGRNIPLRDMFSPVTGNVAPVSVAPTPTTAVSTQSGLRSALTNSSSRFARGQYGSLLSSGPAPGSAGPEQDGFLFLLDQEPEGSKRLDGHKDLVAEMEREERKQVFEIVKDSLEAYAEEGNVQMCAAMAMAAQEELDISSERMEQFSLGYLDQLMRMNLHLNAAYLRKVSPLPFLPDSTTTDAFFHTNCGSCGKLMAGVGAPDTRGRHAFCEKCRRPAARCAICHLPVRGMLYFCHGCGHGGHQKCYQNFYRDQPPTDLVSPPGKFLMSRYGQDEEDEEYEDGDGDGNEEGSEGNPTSTRSHSRSASAEDPKYEDRSESGKSPAPRGRRRDTRRSGSEVTDGYGHGHHGHDTIPEKEAVNYSHSGLTSNHAGGGGASGRKSQNDKRSLSTLKAEEETTLDEDRGIPDEEYVIVREKETDEREAARAQLQLYGHHCAAGCGHFCWMATQ